MSKRYIVFERPEGSKCWTMAEKYSDSVSCNLPAQFLSLERAEKWIAAEHSKRKGWHGGKPNQVQMQAHIAEVELPE